MQISLKQQEGFILRKERIIRKQDGVLEISKLESNILQEVHQEIPALC